MRGIDGESAEERRKMIEGIMIEELGRKVEISEV